MLRYRMAATALKLFSAGPLARQAYRALGNVLGGRRRQRGVAASYIARADANLRAIEACGGIADGMQVLELGTGWVHWEALFTRLFHDVRVILFDVWDNRQFAGFRHHAAELRHRLAAEVPRPGAAIARAEALLDEVLAARDFAEVYALLGFEYRIDPDGALV